MSGEAAPGDSPLTFRFYHSPVARGQTCLRGRPVSGTVERAAHSAQRARDIVPTVETPPDLAGIERLALERLLAALGHERFRAHQIFQWIYRRGIVDLHAMSDLPRALRETMAGTCVLTTPHIDRRERSIDGTEKFLLRLAD